MGKSSTKKVDAPKAVKPVAAAPAKAVKASKKDKKAAKKEPTPEPSSSESDSDDSGSDSDSSEEEAPAKKDAESSDDSDDSSDDSSDDAAEVVAPVKAAVKNAAANVVNAGKAVVNGAAKKVEEVTKKAGSDSDDSSDSDSSEDDAESKTAAKDEDDDSSDDSSDEEEAAPSKKRKADDDEPATAKKAKTDETNEVADTGSKNLFVGNLSWNIDDEWLYREFEEFGAISGARVISDRESGRSKGFGYVEFENSADAAKALKAKKGSLIDGREANVDFSTPRDNTAPKDKAASRAANFGDSQNPPSDTLFLGNLSFEADENIVGEAFGAHGTVTNVRLPTDRETGAPKGFGYVSFDSVESATAAYEAMTGQEIAGRPVRLDYATPRAEQSSFGGGGRGGGRGRGNDRGGRGGGRGGRGSFGGDRGGRGGRGGARGGRGGSTNRGGFGDFKGAKVTFD